MYNDIYVCKKGLSTVILILCDGKKPYPISITVSLLHCGIMFNFKLSEGGRGIWFPFYVMQLHQVPEVI